MHEIWSTRAVVDAGDIDPKTKPVSIDLVITEGNDAGRTQLGVYELTGDTLSLGLNTPGGTTRPAAVAQAELQVTLTKVK